MFVQRRLVVVKGSSLFMAVLVTLLATWLSQMAFGLGQLPLPSPAAGLTTPPLQFVPNVGQAGAEVRYIVQTQGGMLQFTPSEVGISLTEGAGSDVAQARMQFVGANPAASVQAGDLLPGKVNYLLGNDPSQWRTGVETHAGINYTQLYPGVDLQYEGANGQLKGTYSLAVGANPSTIQWRYAGAQAVTVDDQGNLQVALGSGESAATITEQAPIAWQTIDGRNAPVVVSYAVAPEGTIGFAVGAYNNSHPLTIDPAFTFSTFLGGNAADEGKGIATDAQGNMYVVGETASPNFPLINPYQVDQPGNDAFLTKYSPAGTIIYSTYLGGGGNDGANGVAVDAAGSVYITGYTLSTNFPVQNAYQATRPGTGAAFLTRFSPTGASLLYSTYFGGTGAGTITNEAWGVAADAAGNAYIAGRTNSAALPVRNAYQPTYGGSFDAFLAKFNTAAVGDASLAYSTYLGGAGIEYVGTTGFGLGDFGHGVAADGAGNAYIAGQTASTNFPVRSAFQGALSGITDAFVSKVNTAAVGNASLIYSTYLGGTAGDAGKDVAVDAGGNAYVTGETGSVNFPLQNWFATCVNGPFVTKLNPTGNGLVYSTCFGQGGSGRAPDITVDGAGHAYVVGTTSSSTFPMVNAIQPVIGGQSDAFVLKLNPVGNGLVYSTYLGGDQPEQGIGISTDGLGNTDVTGTTRSLNFPLQNPAQPTCGSCPTFNDAFVSRIAESFPPPPSSTPTNTSVPTNTVTATRTATRTATSVATTAVPTMTATRTATGVVTMTATSTATTPVPTISSTTTRTATAMATTAVPTTAVPTMTATPTATSAVTMTMTATPTSTVGPCTERVTICHRTGNGNSHTITISCSAVPAHLAHGDMLGACPQPTPRANPNRFPDVNQADFFYDFVMGLNDAGAISGYSDGTFRPYNQATRGQFVKIAVLAFHIPLYDGEEQHFSDVPTNHTFYQYIETARRDNIIGGYSDGTFRPFANVTRGQVAKIAVESARMQDASTGTATFTDVPPGSTFYIYVETAYANGILSGYSDGTFRPNNDATRGQVAKIIDLSTHPDMRR